MSTSGTAPRITICGIPELGEHSAAGVGGEAVDDVLGAVTAIPLICGSDGRLEGNRKFVDSPLEGDGFEPSVPRNNKLVSRPRRTSPVAMILYVGNSAHAVMQSWINRQRYAE